MNMKTDPPNVFQKFWEKEALMTDYVKASEFDPGSVGAYECRQLPTESEPKAIKPSYHRWFNGKQWSYPIESDLEEEFSPPAADQYPMLQDEIMPFEWRGFKEDPDPL